MKKYIIFALLFSLPLMAAGVSAAPKGKMILGLPADPSHFDPHTRTGSPMSNAFPMVFDSILFRDSSGKVGPGLATSFNWVKPTVLELKIRKGVKFHNGEILDAHAVKYNLDRIFNPKLKSRVRHLYRSLKKVEVVDDYTVRIHTKYPDRYLFSPLADWGYMVAPKYYKSHDLKYLSRHPMGSGPYRLVKWRKGSEMVFEAVPNYWNPSLQPVKTGIYKIIPEDTTRVSALVAGAVDMIKDVPPQMAPMVDADPKIETVAGPGPKVCSILMVFKGDAPWTKLKVRQAINYAIDKESIIKNVLQGHGIPAVGQIVGPRSLGHNPNLKPFPYDLAKAKKLMAEAGYPNGFSVPLMVPIGRYLKGTQAVEAVAGQLKKINIKAKVTPLEYGAWRRNSRSKWEPHRKPYWNYSCRNDTSLHSHQMYMGTLYSKSTHGGIRDKELDKLIMGALETADAAEQIKKYQDLNRLIRDRALLGFLYHLGDIVGKKKTIDWRPQPNSTVKITDASWK
ncbi:ABC transporter substrate-binding protein [Nitrospinota bacterium]